ncbi:MAG: ATP-binding cassette domain-containing protein [Rhodospirillales bacterium]
MPRHVLRLQAVRVSLNGSLMAAVDAEVRSGEVLTVMGPSGSGKSTLLAAIAGFLDPAFRATGRVVLDGEDVTDRPAERRRIGLLFQDALLFPHLSVAGNLLFALPARSPRRRERVAAALAATGLAGFGDRDVATLSGGEKARVALLRVLLSEPRAVLLDEPFSKLDADRRSEVRALVLGQLRAAGLPAVLVTHDAADAEAAGGRVIRLAETPAAPEARNRAGVTPA